MSRRIPAAAALVAALACASPPPPVQKQAWGAPSRPSAPRPAAGPAAPAPRGPWAPSPPPPPLARTRPAPPRTLEAQLPSGVRVVVVEHHRRPVVSVRLVLAGGALEDPRGQAGATWLATQLATDYREADERGNTLYEEKSLRRQLVDLGAAAWADASADRALLAVDAYAADVVQVIETLAEAAMVPRCGAESFDGRRDALLDAIEDVESGDPEALQRVVEEAAFGPGHPYARPVYGTKLSLEPLGLEEVAARQRQLFVPRGATLLVVGDVAGEKVIAAARRAFARWTAEAPPAAHPPAPPRAPARAREVAFLRRKPAATLLTCATRPLGDVRAPDATLEVLAAVLGGGYASRLPEALRERHQLTYGAGASLIVRRHARALVLCAPLAASRGGEGVRIFREVLEAARRAPPGEAELARARAALAARLETAHEDVARSTATWLEAIELGRGRPRLAEDLAALAGVTAADVHAAADAVLRPDALRWVISGDPDAAAAAVRGAGLGPLRPYTPD